MTRFLLAIEWMLATTVAVVLAHIAVEIVGAALLGYFLLFLPVIGAYSRATAAPATAPRANVTA